MIFLQEKTIYCYKKGRYSTGLFFMVNSEEIVVRLKLYFKDRGRVLGAQVGAYLKSRFPEFDYRASFPSLRAYLHSISDGEIRIVDKHGPDDVLEWIPKEPSELAGETVKTPIHVDEDAWKIFVNPTLGGHLFIDPEKCRLFASADIPSEPGYVAINRLSDEEQRLMMREFTDSYSARDDLGELRAATDSTEAGYWMKFYEAARRLGLVKRWFNFRRAKLEALLQQRLRAVGCSDAALRRTPPTTNKSGCSMPDTVSPSPKRQTLSISLSEIAQAALEYLTEEEIRALRLPLGAVFDAIKKQR